MTLGTIRSGVRAGLPLLLGLSLLPAQATASARLALVASEPREADVLRMTYRYGPLVATAGSNFIMLGPEVMGAIAPEDGYLVRLRPGVVGADGAPPPVERVHMHHAVLLNTARRDVTAPELPGERFFGFAEEKTIGELPPPYGYPTRPTDPVAINYMLHNGTARNESVWVELEVDFVPADSDRGRTMRPVRPLWLDVENGSAYPVFDVRRGAGDGRWEYPDDAPGAYAGRPRLNEWRVDRDGVLVSGAGHLHPGGLHVDLRARRSGRTADLFRSEAVYFDPNGPVSWDLAMTVPPPRWRAGVRAGDVLSVHATYETRRASWYESMGIFLAYMADDAGPDPFLEPPATRGSTTHGHLPEAGNHGGRPVGLPDPRERPDGAPVAGGVGIGDFRYWPGDLSFGGAMGAPPVVRPGEALTFGNLDAAAGILHTVTSCRPPCTASTGVSYPLADGAVDFDSGQLGYGPPGLTAAANRGHWRVPADLPPDTYTYFCRVHPFMRGAFRVAGAPREDGSSRGSRPSLRIRRAYARRAGRWRLRVVLACRGAEGDCRGRLRMLSRGPRPRVLGRAQYGLAAGDRRAVRLRLTRAGRRLLRGPAPRRPAIRIEARPADGGPHVRRSGRLRRG